MARIRCYERMGFKSKVLNRVLTYTAPRPRQPGAFSLLNYHPELERAKIALELYTRMFEVYWLYQPKPFDILFGDNRKGKGRVS